MHFAQSRLARSLAVLLLGGAASSALAQSNQSPQAASEPSESTPQLPESSANPSDSGDIIVTANRRAQNLQTVPIAVSVIDGTSLAKTRATMIDDLVSKTPNLQLTSTVGDNTPIFALRGVSMSDYSLNQASPVAVYYDQVYMGNFALLGVAMYDLQRVEVLRGPQGTLYGKNATGGAVNLITNSAKLNETSGYFNVGFGNYNRIDANGAINVPLGNKAAARFAFIYANADGWFENVIPGKPDLAGVREYGLRGSLYFEPSDSIRLTLRGSTSLQNPTNYGIYATPVDVVRPGLSDRQIAANITDKRHAQNYTTSLTADFLASDDLTVTSITSWAQGDLNFYEDTDGQAARILEIPYTDHVTQIAQDLRLTSTFSGKFNFILGIYADQEKVYNSTTLQMYADTDFDGIPGIDSGDCAAGFPLGCYVTNQFDQLRKSFAIYTDATYALTDSWALVAGLRFTHDTGEQNGFTSVAYGPDGGFVVELIPPTDQSFSTDNLSGKIGINYTTSNGDLIYASYNRGYRGQSFNAQAFFDPSELSIAAPETLDAFEVGAKMRLADRRVTLNTAAFYYGYRNQQFISVDPIKATQLLINLPKSQIYGLEAELNAWVSDALDLRASLGLLHTEVKDGFISGTDVAGNQLSNAPPVNFGLGFDWTVVDNKNGKIGLHGDLIYNASQYFEVKNIDRLQQPSYALLNAQITWESANGRFNASLWGKNLTDTFYFTSRIDLLSGWGFDYNHLAAPRTFGIMAGIAF